MTIRLRRKLLWANELVRRGSRLANRLPTVSRPFRIPKSG